MQNSINKGDISLNNEIRFILEVIGAVIGEKEMPETPETLNWDKVYEIAAMHNVANIIGYAIDLGGYKADTEVKRKLAHAVYTAVLVDENQKKEFSELFDAFEKNQIKFMPLKGLVLKGLYPAGDMRNMSDGDILIDINQRGEIEKVMEELGYTFELESNHELVYKKPPFINVELHKYLIPSYNEDLYAYYGDGWKLSRQEGNSSRFSLSTEDTFIYIITHFAKHYRDGGAGIKYIADIWLYKEKNDIDMEYVLTEMENMGLSRFARCIISLADAWFADGEFDSVTLDMTRYILYSGQYGNEKNAALSNTMRENRKRTGDEIKKKRLIYLAFPSIEHMSRNYPVLRKRPYLIMFLWVWRWIRLLIGKTDRKNIKKLEYLSGENISKFESHMKMVGLDIYNGRK